MRRSFLFLLLISGLFAGCVTVEIPKEEYTMAKAAKDAAMGAEAIKYAPQLFYRAEKAYKHAEALYKDRYYKEAREEFINAQKFAERAETVARIKQFQSGDSGGRE